MMLPFLTSSRMILYYPVSALVTLFANILQNPQDARARSDLKLMSSVVSFLTMLERDLAEASGNVNRMLSVCAEFERIARVALDKAEKEMRGRGKRKQAERERDKAIKQRVSGDIALGLEEGKTLEQMQVETQAAYRRPVQTPSLRASIAGSQAGSSPKSWGGSPPAAGNGQEYRNGMQQQQNGHNQNSPYAAAASQAPANATGFFNPIPYPMGGNAMEFNPGDARFAPQQQMSLPDGYSPTAAYTQSPNGFDMQQQFQASGMMPDPNGQFQQPFVPQDLWQMPMTLEWDWAEGLGLGSFAAGPGPNFEGAFGGGDMSGNMPSNMGPPPQG